MPAPANDSLSCALLICVPDFSIRKLNPRPLTIGLGTAKPFGQPVKLRQNACIVRTQKSVVHFGRSYCRSPVAGLEKDAVATELECIEPGANRNMPALTGVRDRNPFVVPVSLCRHHISGIMVLWTRTMPQTFLWLLSRERHISLR